MRTYANQFSAAPGARIARTHANQFPGMCIPPEIKQLEAAGVLHDTSWSNDATASFEFKGKDDPVSEDDFTGYRLWVDWEQPEDREYPEYRWFGMSRVNSEGIPTDLMLQTDALAEVLEFIKTHAEITMKVAFVFRLEVIFDDRMKLSCPELARAVNAMDKHDPEALLNAVQLAAEEVATTALSRAAKAKEALTGEPTVKLLGESPNSRIGRQRTFTAKVVHAGSDTPVDEGEDN